MKTAHTIEQWPVTRLVPYDRNARTHSEAQVAQIAASITQFGFNNPILVDSSSGIIAGHGRLQAARKLGLASVPVIVLDHLTDAQRRAYILADNKLALNAGWDEELLLAELRDLDEMIDLQFTGFDANELERLFATDEDDAPGATLDNSEELQRKWQCERGQRWRIGRHVLLCGDATSADDAQRLFAGANPLLMITDPPYGVEYDASWRQHLDNAFGEYSVGKVANDDRVDWAAAFALFPGDIAYVWHAGTYAADVAISLAAVKFEIRAQVVWVKQQLVLSRGAYHWQHEPCWYAVRKGANANWCGDRKQTTVWEVQNLNPMGGNKEEESSGHGTQKPVELMRRPMRNHTVPGDAVYDPFLGSGTTMVAAEQLNRACYGLEIEPKYCAVILERMSAMGVTGTLAS